MPSRACLVRTLAYLWGRTGAVVSTCMPSRACLVRSPAYRRAGIRRGILTARGRGRCLGRAPIEIRTSHRDARGWPRHQQRRRRQRRLQPPAVGRRVGHVFGGAAGLPDVSFKRSEVWGAGAARSTVGNARSTVGNAAVGAGRVTNSSGPGPARHSARSIDRRRGGHHPVGKRRGCGRRGAEPVESIDAHAQPEQRGGEQRRRRLPSRVPNSALSRVPNSALSRVPNSALSRVRGLQEWDLVGCIAPGARLFGALIGVGRCLCGGWRRG
jgi:hypothetical protein